MLPSGEILLSIPVAMYFKVVPKGWIEFLPSFTHGLFIGEIPFLHQMGITFLITMFIIYVISYLEGNQDDPKELIYLEVYLKLNLHLIFLHLRY
ncbi:MAG: hypothetical protein Ct9H90mP3_3560 [Flammeovirgaceae bacterium]|nr:MAG: hypothetical protein Ct9H90mP3_3560 [Flammeovirgaceae bacterium]